MAKLKQNRFAALTHDTDMDQPSGYDAALERSDEDDPVQTKTNDSRPACANVGHANLKHEKTVTQARPACQRSPWYTLQARALPREKVSLSLSAVLCLAAPIPHSWLSAHNPQSPPLGTTLRHLPDALLSHSCTSNRMVYAAGVASAPPAPLHRALHLHLHLHHLAVHLSPPLFRMQGVGMSFACFARAARAAGC